MGAAFAGKYKSLFIANQGSKEERLAELLPDKQAAALFYCNGPKCGRSAKAISIALDCGYQQLFWYRGGIEAWISQDFPVNHN